LQSGQYMSNPATESADFTLEIMSKNVKLLLVFCVPYSNHEKQKYWLWWPKKKAGMYSYSCYTSFLNMKVMAQ